MLHGRVDELARIGQLLADARRAQGGALVLRGEAGIGKTLLLDHASELAGGMRVLRGIGIEFEAELPFAGLHMLLHPFLDRLDALPGRQADVLRGAFGIAETIIRDRFLIGVATLTLLSEIADDRPLLCLLDDAQWLDDASSAALLFAARRLTAEPVAMIFAVRGDEAVLPAPGVEAVPVRGLDPSTAAALLAEYAPGLADPVRARVLREADGNPLALIELAAALAAEQHSGRVLHEFHVGPLPAIGRVQDAFRRQIADLPAATQLALVVAAADDTTGVDVIVGAGEALGLSAADLDPAVRGGLINSLTLVGRARGAAVLNGELASSLTRRAPGVVGRRGGECQRSASGCRGGAWGDGSEPGLG